MEIKQFDGKYPWMSEVKTPTHEDLQREYNYLVAERLTKMLLEAGYLTEDEYKRVMKRNKETFKPMLAALMSDD